MCLPLLPHERLQFLDYDTWWTINHNWLTPRPWPLTLHHMMLPLASWTPHDSHVLRARAELQLITSVWVCCFMESFYLMPQENTALGPSLSSACQLNVVILNYATPVKHWVLRTAVDCGGIQSMRPAAALRFILRLSWQCGAWRRWRLLKWHWLNDVNIPVLRFEL